MLNRELVGKIKQLPNAFEYKGDEYVVKEYGGTGLDSYIYWASGRKGIRMEYAMIQTGPDSFRDVDKIKRVELYDENDNFEEYTEF